jgi:hypothetical protein
VYIYIYNWYQQLTNLYVQLQRVQIRDITFPSPLFIHCPQCIQYTSTYKISKILKNMQIVYPHIILTLPSCILKTGPGPLDLYQLHELTLELFYFPIQYANCSHLKIAFLLHLNHLPMINIDQGGYWWPPTYSNWLLLSVFSSTHSSVIICNCGFDTSGVV